MKILWLSNVEFSHKDLKSTGSWLQPMAEALVASKEVDLINITNGNVNEAVSSSFLGIKQWVLPIFKTKGYGQIASLELCQLISTIINTEQPDLIHIWGTERMWASIYAQGFIKGRCLLEIQGLIKAYTQYSYGGLSSVEILKTVYLKELLMPARSLWGKKRTFYKRGVLEKKYLQHFSDISVQSEWVKNNIEVINPSANLYRTKMMLRKAFYDSSSWKYKGSANRLKIFSAIAGGISYKGLHILLKAVALIKESHPDFELRLAGNVFVGNRLLDGYAGYLKSLIQKFDLKHNVVFLGFLNENELISELQNCSVCVVPSFIETYCLAFAESMMVGAPTVVAYSGAMPELAQDGNEAMFYNANDDVTCASKILQCYSDRELAEKLSRNGRQRRFIENNQQEVINTQLNIYRTITNN